MTEQHTHSTQGSTGSTGASLSNAAVGPLTIRDLAVLGSVLIIFVASLVPIIQTLVGSLNLWNTGGLFYLAIGVILPLIVGGLFLARRMSPGTKIRIGSLSTDQFASVVASFATFFFFTGTVTNFGIAYLVGLIGALLLLVSTVCAQWIPALAADYSGRVETPAHPAARDAVPALKRPAAPKPVAGVGGAKAGPQGTGKPGGFGKGASFGAGASGQVAGVPTPEAPVAGAPVAGAGASWGTQQAPAGHTSAGQIFTPAREASPAAQAANTVAGASATPAATSTQTFPVATNAQQESAPESSTPSVSEASDVATPASAEAAQPAEPALAEPAPAVEPSNEGVTDDDNATSLNPQVAPAAEQAPVPAAADPVSPVSVKESIGATVNPQAAASVIAEPFWFAVDRPQNVIDERTRQFVFKLNPGAWILALEDRGNSFLVQDSHGKTGVLLDLVGIERASDSQ
ncbi:hypothetical protein SAMN04489740_2964 [Arthrobacter alpinus]|uniref:Uncharacterized protein n=1 Tax=Arthrobacter alpinus TaxID=656366 RepID=A0A1H5MIC1_9MICC|nr:hypothetical protein [Arthrobacter alpinus]SEE89145.1 hypothetical protein SAMN04489740_2964 [Arthrobacter alpinus]